MDQPEQKFATPSSIALDVVLTLAVFAFFTWVLHSHVPTEDPFYMWLWGAISASCMAGVFWLALQMFRVVLRAQLAERKK